MILRSSATVKGLRRLRHRRRFVAGAGGHGAGKNRHGAGGRDVEIQVPVGTVVTIVNEGSDETVDLAGDDMTVVVAKGGRGGRGNARFVSATNRFPVLSEEGDPGATATLRLEQKLFADAGIVGAPNAGKSSLLAALTGADPKVADYPFTTLEPSLGTAETGYDSIVIVDIPGLIEGAHVGVGLGHDFLRHVERARVLIHMIDGEKTNLIDEYGRIRAELVQFDATLADKQEIVVVNKVDLEGVEEKAAHLQMDMGGRHVRRVSALARLGLDELMRDVTGALAEVEPDRGRRPEMEAPVIRPKPADRPTKVVREGDGYAVPVRAAERIAARVDPGDWEARAQLLEQLRRMGVTAALVGAGVRPGDVVRIGKLELEWD